MTAVHPVARFVPGFVGTPGQRTFYFEVEAVPGRAVWYVAEKTQVAAFAAESLVLLAELGFIGAGAHLDVTPMRTPETEGFRIGELGLEYVEADRVVLVRLAPVNKPAEGDVHAVTPAQLDAAARIAVTAVEAGRPSCRRCGLAMDPEGHICPTTNGDLRGHRP